ncbi:hypothetical protein N9216_01530 [Pseudomonadales bacterium]|nr:hypothetical protein [Pseudomonadales bacterium]
MAINFLNTVAVDENVLFVDTVNDRVGIGTDSPEGNLEISDSTQATGATLSITNAHIGSWVTGDKIGSIDFRIDDTSTAEPVRAKIHAEGKTTGTYPLSSQLVFSTTNANTLSESMRITSAGNVGIGTSTPSNTLQVGDGTEDSAIAVYYSDAQYTRLHGYGLYMSRIASYIRPINTTTQTLHIGAPSNIWNAITNNANTHYFRTGANEHMRINSAGNVGINTTSPDFKLDVDGTFGVSDLPFNTDSVSVLVADETTGVEEVTNGSFTTDADWNKNSNWTISGGTANADGTSNANMNQIPVNGYPAVGEVFRVSFEVTARTQGQVRIKYGGAETAFVSAVGQYEYILTATTIDRIKIQSNDSFIGSVDNLSIKQITSASNQIQKRELGTGAFGPTPVGAYLPLSAGSSYPLTGDLYLDDGSGATPSLYFKNGDDNFWRYLMESGGDFSIKEGTSTRLTFQAAGNVGIGTVSPNSKLQIKVGTDQNIGFNSHSSVARISSYNDAFTASSPLKINGSDLRFDISSVEKMRITSTGNVGIGTTSPASKLTVGGNAAGFATAMQVWQDGETAASGDIGGKAATFFGTSGLSNSSIVNIYATGVYTGQTGGEIGFGGKYASGGNVAQFAKIRSFKTNASDGGVNYGGGLQFWTRPNGSAAVPRMTILGDGNVGIGTDSPDAKLSVNGYISIESIQSNPSTVAGEYRLALGHDATTDASWIQSNGVSGTQRKLLLNPEGGNVGIGTTLPGFKLDVTGEGNFTSYLNVNSSAGIRSTGWLHLQRYATNLNVSVGNNGTNVHFLVPNGDIRIKTSLLSNQENTDIDTGAEVVAQVAHATYTAAFFDFVVKKGTNVRSGTVYACHNGDTTPLVEFTETSTNDLGDTSDVTLSVDISGTNMRLLATVTSDDWSVKSLIRAI